MANDVGEVRRILNSFLLMIEQDDSNSVIVAATNHPDILDEALFRRFDDVVEYHLPTPPEILALLRMRSVHTSSQKKDLNDLAAEATGLSHAEIARAIGDAVKEAVMHDQDAIPAEALSSCCNNAKLCPDALLAIRSKRNRSAWPLRIRNGASISFRRTPDRPRGTPRRALVVAAKTSFRRFRGQSMRRTCSHSSHR